MVLEAELSRFLGILSDTAVARLTKCLAAYGLPISADDKVVRRRSRNVECPVDELMAIMNLDKKNDGSKKRVVLLAKIGKTYEMKASSVPDQIIRTILSEHIIVGDYSQSPQHSEVIPPGSKSISNRVLVLASLANGTVRIKNLLHSDDTEYMLNALGQLGGAVVSWEDAGETLVVSGSGGSFTAPDKEIYLGNAGTASRFLASLATFAAPTESQKEIVLTGNARMKQRPIGPLVDALNSNGAQITYDGNEGSYPLRISLEGPAKGFKGGKIEVAATMSSQYVSSLLMSAPYAENPVTLSLIGGKPISELYIDMTISMMETFGVKVQKSASTPYTYHIPSGPYVNPDEYVVESDASSATYPLAFAALTGTSCTVPNIGSSSLQGDARFAVEVLRPMGCDVIQTATSTTVKGPPVGSLIPLEQIDMEPMTDAFLTASVVAAVARAPKLSAKTASNTTRIIGIANQRVKECNRIDAMIHELAKFGVTCRELSDGLEIDGVAPEDLIVPEHGVSTYDDHRVAMSFSLLSASIRGQPVIIKERRCVEKTWPGWWDVLRNAFKVEILGYNDAVVDEAKGRIRTPNKDKTIVIVGMRGSGKSSLGKWISNSVGLKFVDLDEYLEAKLQISIAQLIKEKGWDEFRKEELEVLREFLNEHPRGYVAACGGGLVETPEARELLKQHIANGRIVLQVHRNIDDIIDFLSIDTSRPAFVDDLHAVWARREHWYFECSNHFYYASRFNNDSESTFVRYSLDSFLQTITGERPVLVPDYRSYFLSLTYPDLRVIDNFDTILEGSNAVELRVDLLHESGQAGPIATLDYVCEQIGYLRMQTTLPIIFTIRTLGQGGQFPDGAEEEAEKLIRLALKLGIEFIDLELTWSESFQHTIARDKGYSKIISSHHNFKGDLKWDHSSWEDYYMEALKVADVVKFVGFAKDLDDNTLLENFRKVHTRKPLIAINMGRAGQLSRVLNTVFTPVTHDLLPVKAAPGQLTVKQINKALLLIGGIEPKQFFITGDPVTHSRSPPLHNSLFESLGLPHNYSRLQTSKAQDVIDHIRNLPNCGGCSITMPLKLDLIPLLDEITDNARIIGAINTITVRKDGSLIGTNTDWIGIINAFEAAGVAPVHIGNYSALIVGAGGTARAAIFALHKLGFKTINLVNRSLDNALALIEAFPDSYNLKILESAEDLNSAEAPLVAVSCVPADKPLDEDLQKKMDVLLSKPVYDEPFQKTLLDVSYKPLVTPLMKLANAKYGFKVVAGREMLLYQGIEQFRIWNSNATTSLVVAKKALFEE